jgi:hypothetical protein
VLASNRTLREFKLTALDLSDAFIEVLCKALQTNNTLRILDLNQCKLSSISFERIATEVMKTNTTIIELRIQNPPTCTIARTAEMVLVDALEVTVLCFVLSFRWLIM